VAFTPSKKNWNKIMSGGRQRAQTAPPTAIPPPLTPPSSHVAKPCIDAIFKVYMDVLESQKTLQLELDHVASSLQRYAEIASTSQQIEAALLRLTALKRRLSLVNSFALETVYERLLAAIAALEDLQHTIQEEEEEA
jgi:hypothetical protein